MLRHILVFDIDDRGVTVLYGNGQVGLTDPVHHSHRLRTFHGDGHLVVLHLVEVGRGLDLDRPDAALQRLSHTTCELIVKLILVLLELIHLQLAVLLQVELHAHVVLVVEVGKLHGYRQVLAIEVFVADALHHVAHVEVHVLDHLQQEPWRLHGVQLIVHVRRASDAHQSTNLCQTAHLSHQSAKGIVVPDHHLRLLHVFRRCDHEIDYCQQYHYSHRDDEPSLFGETQFDKLADRQLIVIHVNLLILNSKLLKDQYREGCQHRYHRYPE